MNKKTDENILKKKSFVFCTIDEFSYVIGHSFRIFIIVVVRSIVNSRSVFCFRLISMIIFYEPVV